MMTQYTGKTAPMDVRLDYVHHNPGETRFESAYLDPTYLNGLGYTGQVLDRHVQAAVSLRSMFPDLWDSHPEGLFWTRDYAKRLQEDLKRTKEQGLSCLAWTDFVVLPKVLVDRYQEELTTDVEVDDPFDVKGKVRPNIQSSFTQDVLRTQIREIFETFPDLDGLVVRVGETYLHNLPHHTGGDPIVDGVESHVTLLQLLREEICVKHGKQLIYRTWMSGIDERAQPYVEATNRIEPHPGLYFVIKHCIGDYHRTHPFSPPLGKGNHKQLVEIQCQREYEGKGAFPNFIAAGVIDGFEEYAHLMAPGELRSVRQLIGLPQTAGLLTWSRGGGWKGPYIKDELWCDINARVLLKWAQNPGLPTEQVTESVLEDLGFDSPSRELLVEILNLSAMAVVRGVTGMRGDINTLWSRDEYFGGFEQDSPFMKQSVESLIEAGNVEPALAEAAEAVCLWKRIESLSEQVNHADPSRQAFIRTSCTYGRIYQQVIHAGWTVILLGEQATRSHTRDDKRIRKALEDYHRAWSEWRELSQRPECATIYNESYCHYVADHGMVPVDGMGASVKRYSRMLELMVEHV
ncbi:hypothetical protein HW115_07725 [Verrucomicrobiaceae bacterium N1E253]|uniref:Uncharacterized protein n=1 Tax=Oceaniferula marina TaxID=2748318 RepID=A0A851GDK2_9BACT|nr:hypothetical protein [Oceaniferula marina]NWK55496.1 hypothetical protein [Oceaniferula marina]